jgi:hypothetical protein
MGDGAGKRLANKDEYLGSSQHLDPRTRHLMRRGSAPEPVLTLCPEARHPRIRSDEGGGIDA